jgi:enoyl-CoA hydratase/carnithine racemase
MEILTSRSGGVLTIEFNRAERKNAITTAMYQAIADALLDGDKDPGVRAVLLTGKPEIFTAGNDLDDFLRNSAPVPGVSPQDRPVFQFMRALSGMSKPVVAAVSGAAIGIGTTMLMHCDLVYAGDNAKFSLPFAQLGLCPEFGSSLLLPQLAGYPRAAEKLMLGEPFGAQEALEMGLVSKVLPAAELRAFAEQQAAKLAALPAASIRATKALMKRPGQQQLAETLAIEGKQFFDMLQGAEAKEAFTAFFEKRKPDFSRFS